MADLSNREWLNAPVIMWSGLGSESNQSYWGGKHEMQQRIPGAQLIKSGTGYAHWDVVAEHIADTGQRKVLIGHSNGVYAITKIAEAVDPRKCRLISLDKTLKGCPHVGGNVDRVADIWFGLSKLRFASDFAGHFEFHDYSYNSHVGGTYDPKVQDLVVNRANAWK